MHTKQEIIKPKQEMISQNVKHALKREVGEGKTQINRLNVGHGTVVDGFARFQAQNLGIQSLKFQSISPFNHQK